MTSSQKISALAVAAIVDPNEPVPANIEYLGELRREQADKLRAFQAEATPLAWLTLRNEVLEEAAKLSEEMPGTTLNIWERPGGPPGNGVRTTTNGDVAAAIRALKRHRPA